MKQSNSGMVLTRDLLEARRKKLREELIALLLSGVGVPASRLSEQVHRYAETVATLSSLEESGEPEDREGSAVAELDFDETRAEILERAARILGT